MKFIKLTGIIMSGMGVIALLFLAGSMVLFLPEQMALYSVEPEDVWGSVFFIFLTLSLGVTLGMTLFVLVKASVSLRWIKSTLLLLTVHAFILGIMSVALMWGDPLGDYRILLPFVMVVLVDLFVVHRIKSAN